MDLSLTEEQLLIQQTARRFAQDQLAPVADVHDQRGDRVLFLANLRHLAELGFMGLNVDTRFGGAQAGTVAFSLAMTEIARGCAATAVTMSVTNMVAEVIQAVGTPAQQQAFIPKLCSGEFAAGSFCLSEAGAGSDPAGMKTTATQTVNGWQLNGSKSWITSAEYAGVFVVWAVTDAKRPKGKGISCFLVDAQTPGISFGKAEEKMGQHGSATNSVHFDQCEIPADALLGRFNEGYRIAVEELAGGRIGVGSMALGIAQSAMDYARNYVTEREQFGQAISQFQGPQWMLAETYTDLEAARLLLMNAAYLKEAEKPFTKEASMAKLFASECGNKACYTALQLLGGVGYTKELPLERHARDIRITSIYEGTSEIQKVIIARELLKEIA